MVIDLYGPVYFIAICLEKVWGFITAAVVYQVPPTPRSSYVLCQPDSLALLPAKQEELKGSKLSTQKGGHKQKSSADKASFLYAVYLPFLHHPVTIFGLVPFPALLLVYDLSAPFL